MLMYFYFPSYLTILVFSDEKGLDRQYELEEEKPGTSSSGGNEAMTTSPFRIG
jgi:hypothetical protein